MYSVAPQATVMKNVTSLGLQTSANHIPAGHSAARLAIDRLLTERYVELRLLVRTMNNHFLYVRCAFIGYI
jgi:hypothetical protein